ncbi:MAG TPA: Asp23/Gls24 family envelope stress response protein [Pseudonocardiaceae bacterium]|nr:Asp23/Gls24 family envelope stress response protein [Pseudonocardiaceae bacterium]
MSPTPARDHDTVADIQIAAVAAATAKSIPGVTRLQPGVWGLVQQLSRELWERITGEPFPDIAGVDAAILDDATATLDITLATNGHRPATVVVADVQHAVTTAIAARLAIPVSAVAVHVCEISLPP